MSADIQKAKEGTNWRTVCITTGRVGTGDVQVDHGHLFGVEGERPVAVLGQLEKAAAVISDAPRLQHRLDQLAHTAQAVIFVQELDGSVVAGQGGLTQCPIIALVFELPDLPHDPAVDFAFHVPQSVLAVHMERI
ncbi:hypothetical protein AYO21_07504 [Fonsecaea monophora]|uniref:Uncharacterized protein n=1 Tax=Fonsecaea monophora TaxID=254056 RepID=A0A177F202_9EURO|nr:hypothetical protein AYO21_07504 [Fonsecaea monophora]KAH0830057.1 hypothetical protein FOPE_10847 [Fonsecaea pedrosoi]OAG38278.1 hypothetical protein AYO21_07504 [Fonsecaea monophora]